MVDLQGVLRKVAHHEVEDLVQEFLVHVGYLGVFQDELAIDDAGEQLAQDEQKIDVLLLLRGGSGRGEEGLQLKTTERIESRIILIFLPF